MVQALLIALLAIPSFSDYSPQRYDDIFQSHPTIGNEIECMKGLRWLVNSSPSLGVEEECSTCKPEKFYYIYDNPSKSSIGKNEICMLENVTTRCFTVPTQKDDSAPIAVKVMPEGHTMWLLKRTDTITGRSVYQFRGAAQLGMSALQSEVRAKAQKTPATQSVTVAVELGKGSSFNEMVQTNAKIYNVAAEVKTEEWGLTTKNRITATGSASDVMEFYRGVNSELRYTKSVSSAAKLSTSNQIYLENLKTENKIKETVLAENPAIPVYPVTIAESRAKSDISSNIERVLKGLSLAHPSLKFDSKLARKNDAAIYKSCEPFVRESQKLSGLYCQHLERCQLKAGSSTGGNTKGTETGTH